MPFSEIKLRQAGLTDLEDLALMSFDFSPALPLEQHKRRVKQELESHETQIIMLKQTIMGYLVFRIQKDKDDNTDVAELHRFYIKPEARRQGVARAAMHLWIEQYLSPPAQILLSVALTNEDARAFYKALGFEEKWLTLKKTV